VRAAAIGAAAAATALAGAFLALPILALFLLPLGFAMAVWVPAAILHAAVYDAVDAIAKTNAPYLVDLGAPRHASEPAAAAAAAHAVLVRLYPTQAAALDADLAVSLSQVPNGRAKDQGVRVGEEAAAAILTARSEDGSLYRSADLGATWKRFDHGVKANSTMMAVALHHGDPDQVFCVSRTGQVFGTLDAGRSWREDALPAGVKDVYAVACG